MYDFQFQGGWIHLNKFWLKTDITELQYNSDPPKTHRNEIFENEQIFLDYFRGSYLILSLSKDNKNIHALMTHLQ